jgi:hypothetical protein
MTSVARRTTLRDVRRRQDRFHFIPAFAGLPAALTLPAVAISPFALARAGRP